MPSENRQCKRKGEILSHDARQGLLSQVEVKAVSIPKVRNGKAMQSKGCRRRRGDAGAGAGWGADGENGDHKLEGAVTQSSA